MLKFFDEVDLVIFTANHHQGAAAALVFAAQAQCDVKDRLTDLKKAKHSHNPDFKVN